MHNSFSIDKKFINKINYMIKDILKEVLLKNKMRTDN